MTVTGPIFFLAALGFLLIQGVLVRMFVACIRTASPTNGNRPDGFPLQPVAIVLCVRGNDPSLDACLSALAQQDYPNKKILIVGDHEQDPGIQLALQYRNRLPGLFEITINDEILTTCSVKCSNLIHVIRKWEAEFEYFVLVDADTVPGPEWLQRMLAPFADPAVNVTSGIRWFRPVGRRIGTWVRFVWNAAAIVQMVCYRIPWGGSLAIRTSFARESQVLDEWSRGFCEDTMLQRISRDHGGRVEVVPGAIIESEEQISLRNCVPWISRQLLTARLHHPRWPLVLVHGLTTGFLAIGPIVLGAFFLLIHRYDAMTWMLSMLAAVYVGNHVLMHWINSAVAGRIGAPMPFGVSASRYLLAMVVTPFAYFLALMRTVSCRRIQWRQVAYRLRGKKIEMLGCGPYEQPNDDHSL